MLVYYILFIEKKLYHILFIKKLVVEKQHKPQVEYINIHRISYTTEQGKHIKAWIFIIK